jgi:hypothetical protein
MEVCCWWDSPQRGGIGNVQKVFVVKGHLFASDLSLFAFYITKHKRVMKAYFATAMECKVYDIHV